MSQQINLYQPRFRRQRKRFSARHLPLAVAAVLAGCAALYGYAAMKTRQLDGFVREATVAADQQRRALAELKEKFPAFGASKLLAAEVARLEAELQRRNQLLGALSTGELGNTQGFSEFLAALGRRDLPGVWLVGVKIGDAGSNLQVQGRALGADMVPAYLKSLGAEPMMQGRRVTELKLATRTVPPGKGGKAGAKGPERFVEFEFYAPLAAQVKPAAKEAAK